MPVAHVRRHVHADPPFALDLPDEVELIELPGMLLTALRPAGATASPFRSNLTVVAEALPDGLDLDAYCEGSLAVQARMFPHWRVIDREATELGGEPALRTLATYRAARDSGADFGRVLSVTVEQWRLIAGRTAWVASASCETPEYALVGEAWAASVGSLRVGAAA